MQRCSIVAVNEKHTNVGLSPEFDLRRSLAQNRNDNVLARGGQFLCQRKQQLRWPQWIQVLNSKQDAVAQSLVLGWRVWKRRRKG